MLRVEMRKREAFVRGAVDGIRVRHFLDWKASEVVDVDELAGLVGEVSYRK